MNQQALIRQQIATLVDQYAAIALAPKPFIPGTTPVNPILQFGAVPVFGDVDQYRQRDEQHLLDWRATGAVA